MEKQFKKVIRNLKKEIQELKQSYERVKIEKQDINNINKRLIKNNEKLKEDMRGYQKELDMVYSTLNEN